MGRPVWQASKLTVHWEQDAERSLRCTRFHESWAHTVSRNGYVFCFLEKKKHLFTQKATISWQRSWTGQWTLFPALTKCLCHIRFPLLPCFNRLQTKIKILQLQYALLVPFSCGGTAMQKWCLPTGSAFVVCPNNLEMAPANCHCVSIFFCKRGQQ